MLTVTERRAVLNLLDGVIIRFQIPAGAFHYTPVFGAYFLALGLPDHKQYFNFKADGLLLHGNLTKEKLDELARIIIAVAQRMPALHVCHALCFTHCQPYIQ